MNEIEKLLALVSDNEEAKGLIQKIKESTENNVSTINRLETTVNEIKQTRDKFKEGNSLVKKVLGIDQINEDTISSVLGKKTEPNTEIDNLKNLLKKADDEKNTIKSEYEQKINGFFLDNAILKAGLKDKARNEKTFKDLRQDVLNGATVEGDQIVYKNEKGETIYNGSSPLTVESKIEMMRNDELFDPYFQERSKNGTGASNRTSKGATSISRSNFDSMGQSERKAFLSNGGIIN